MKNLFFGLLLLLITHNLHAEQEVLLYQEPKQITHFDVSSSKGTFSKDSFLGKWSVVFFGYTNCPDICPTGFMTAAYAKKALSKYDVNDEFYFVSVDPDRDSHDHLEKYANFFHKDIHAVTNVNQDIIDEITSDFGAVYEFHDPDGDDMDIYTVDHTADFFVVSPEGKLVAILPFPHDAQSVGKAILELSQGKQ